ncbi:MAG TPA: DMT family transporter [Burkholderiales bacterium]|nr:DMT family transporter [Burkholderiales bacterium]
MTHKRPALPIIALFVGGVATGFTPILIRLTDVGPTASAFWRFSLALPLLWCWLFIHERQRNTGASALPSSGLVWVAGIFLAADLGVWHWSVFYTSVANSTFIGNVAPIFVAIGAWLVFRQRLSCPILVGMFTAFTGMALMAGPNFGAGGTHLLGDGLAVLAAAFFATYLLMVKHARASVTTAQLMAVSTTVSALVLLPVVLLLPQPMWPVSATEWLVLFALALVPQIIGQGAIAYAFAHLPVTLSAIGLMIQPVVAALMAWWLFGETLGWSGLVGAGLVLVGIFLSRRVAT